MQILQKKVSKNDGEAQNIRGVLLYHGIYVEKDLDMANKMFKMSSESGNKLGRFNYLFQNYLNIGSKGVIDHIKSDLNLLSPEVLYKLALSVLPQNSFFDNQEISFQLMNLAAEKEFPIAYQGLAWFYRYGKFV